MKLLPLLLTVCASFFLTSCSDDKKGDQFASDFISEMEKFPTIIGSITDSASTDQAVKDIDALAARIEELAADHKSTRVSKSKDKEIQSRVEAAMTPIGADVDAAMIKLGSMPEVTEADMLKIANASEDFGNRLMAIDQ